MKAEDQAKRIFGERAAFYTTSPAHTEPQALQRLVELCAAQPHWRALDIATGTGHTALALAPYVTSVTAIDLTAAMLAQAEQLRAQQRRANVVFRVADVHHLPFGDGCFDLITCRRAAHHFSDIRGALREIRRVLRPRGRLIIDDRSVPEDDAIDVCMNQLDRLHDASHIREYRPSEWRIMLGEAGFAVHSIEVYVRHRPLSAFTEGVSAEQGARIHSVIATLDHRLRARLDVRAVDGQPHLNHWYVLVAATTTAAKR